MRLSTVRGGFMIAILVALAVRGARAENRDDELNDDSFERLRAYILPEAEEAWLKIPWRTVFLDAVAEARRQHKPVVFWAMSGHPLGCT